ncbi:MAG: Uma2 family endonuclease [Phormidesmis sp.]
MLSNGEVIELPPEGRESSANYRRDYEWKRQQYEWWQILEYWIIDRHRQQVVVFTLTEGIYAEHRYCNADTLQSATFPTLQLSASQVLFGDLI